MFMEGKRESGRAMPRAVWMPRIAMVSALYYFWMCLEPSGYYLFVTENSRLVTNSKRERGKPLNRPLF